jgi:hypothetical protein
LQATVTGGTIIAIKPGVLSPLAILSRNEFLVFGLIEGPDGKTNDDAIVGTIRIDGGS